VTGHEVPDWLCHFDSLVLAAGQLAEVELGVVPHLLQTKAYADAAERSTELPLSDHRPFMAVTLDISGVARYHEDPDVVKKFVSRFEHLHHTALPRPRPPTASDRPGRPSDDHHRSEPTHPVAQDSFSVSAANCVELADAGGAVWLRDSKHPEGGHLTFTRTELAALVAACKAGELDDLTA
jgi:hypothetical protein